MSAPSQGNAAQSGGSRATGGTKTQAGPGTPRNLLQSDHRVLMKSLEERLPGLTIEVLVLLKENNCIFFSKIFYSYCCLPEGDRTPPYLGT